MIELARGGQIEHLRGVIAGQAGSPERERASGSAAVPKQPPVTVEAIKHVAAGA